MAGRKLSFDPDVALEQMMRVFWEKGYSGTSVDDLCQAVGVPKPSLYSYYGDKEEILVRALHFYGTKAPQRRSEFGAGSLSERLLKLMLATRFEGAVDAPSPAGCFLVNGVAEFMGASPKIDQALTELIRLNDKGLAAFFEEARDRSELKRDTDVKKLAVQVNTFIRGLAVSRKAGASARSLREQIEFYVDMLVGAVGRA